MTSLKHQNEELTIRLKKYEERVMEFEEQNIKHNDIHEKVKHLNILAV